MNFKQLLSLEDRTNAIVASKREKVDKYNDLLAQATEKLEKKKYRGLGHTLSCEINEFIRVEQAKLASRIFNRLFEMEGLKNENGILVSEDHLLEVKNLYLLLSRQGRLNVRYLKLPKCWLEIGMLGGVLEELIVILRTPAQIGMGAKHMHTVEELMSGIQKLQLAEECEGKTDIRFLFLTKLTEQPTANVRKLLELAITCQGPSKRIGMHEDDDTLYLYAIQGIYGGIVYDERVVTTITPDTFPYPNFFAVHFTRANIADAIWNSVVIDAPRSREKPLAAGSICKFDRAIHALTCVDFNFNDNSYMIAEDKVGIRDRMVHGINDTIERPKYQAGLVIDILLLCCTLPIGKVQINELGTLLVHDDIPRECIVECLQTDEQLRKFWRL